MTYAVFKNLMQEWYKDTAMLSCGKLKHKNYKLVLDALENEKEKIISYLILSLGNYTLIALSMLSKHIVDNEKPPIDKYYDGRIPVLKECWLYWGLEKKYIGIKLHPTKSLYISCFDLDAIEDPALW